MTTVRLDNQKLLQYTREIEGKLQQAINTDKSLENELNVAGLQNFADLFFKSEHAMLARMAAVPTDLCTQYPFTMTQLHHVVFFAIKVCHLS